MPKSIHHPDHAKVEIAFQQYLKFHGIKYTRPRRLILKAVLRIKEHFEAEQLLIHMRQAGHHVAKATIYRTLPLLVACGILKQVRFSDHQSHYEFAFEEQPHDHMVCQRCGRIIEFDSRRVVQLRGLVARENNFNALMHRFQIIGLCSTCNNLQD